MATALPLVSYSTLEEQIEALERDGYLYIPGFLNADEVAELRAAAQRIEPLPENLDTDMTPEHDGYLNKCINNAFNRDPLFLKYLDKPGLIDLAEAIHGTDCHIIAMHTWMVGPGRPTRRCTPTGCRSRCRRTWPPTPGSASPSSSPPPTSTWTTSPRRWGRP